MVFRFHVKADDVHTAFPRVAEQQLHEVAFALAAVAEYEDVGIGLVRCFPPKVNKQVAAILVVTDIKALRVGLPAVIEGEQVARAGGGEDALELLAETVFAAGLHALKAFLLPEEQLVRRDLGARQLRLHVSLHLLQLFQCRCGNLYEHRAVQQNFAFSAQLHRKVCHVADVRIGDGLLLHIAGAPVQQVAAGGVFEYLLFLSRCGSACINTERDARTVAQMPQQRQLIRVGRVFPYCPDTAERVAADIVIRIKFKDGRAAQVKEFFDPYLFFLRLRPWDVDLAFLCFP